MRRHERVIIVVAILVIAILSLSVFQQPNRHEQIAEPVETDEVEKIHPPVNTPEPTWLQTQPHHSVTATPDVTNPPEETPEPTPEPPYVAYTEGENLLIVFSDGRSLHRSGSFNITGYCGCEICCGEWGKDRPKDAYGIEIVYGALGIRLQPDRSVAVDPNVIPYRSNVYIGGREFVAEDRGPNGNHVDIYHLTHSEASHEIALNLSGTATVYWSEDTFSYYELQTVEQDILANNILIIRPTIIDMEETQG